MKKVINTKGTHGLLHNPGCDFQRLVYWMNKTDAVDENVHIAPYFIPTLALLGACFSLESYINMVGQTIDEDWNSFDKGPVPVKDRLERIYSKLNKSLNCGGGIWQEVLWLFKIRVSLVHPQYVNKTETRTEHYEIPTIFQKVKQEYPPEKSKRILENAIDALLKDADLLKLKDHWQMRTYDEFPSEIYQVHEILDRYIAIHDKIFKFSLRKAIPIPGISKPIDYGLHFRELSSLISALEKVAESASNRDVVPNVFQQFVTALLKTMQFLRDMCQQLHGKSQGDLQSYSRQQYKSDIARYEGLVEEYRSRGSALNDYIHK